VPRRSQKYFKPEFFSFLSKEKDARDAVRATRDWITENEVEDVSTSSAKEVSVMTDFALFLSALQTGSSGWRPGGWSHDEVVLELSSVLKASDADLRRDQPSQQQQRFKPPPMHYFFSRMEFMRASGNGIRAQQLNEGDIDADQGFESLVAEYPNPAVSASNTKSDEGKGGWLESDDIEDF
jgi:cell cycle checkpoint protein